ncbi:hypothetical protein G7046_g6850 [Stylonectria norvegica]|nr:hypothetical protein G7046_g6850 [Stylonectria norvegica]
MATRLNPVADLVDGIEKTAVGNGTSSSSKKPYLVFGTAPADGHTIPLVRIAGQLVQRGFGVTFLTGVQFEESIKAVGAEFEPVSALFTPKIIAERNEVPGGIPRLLYDLEKIFIGQTPSRWETLKAVLEKLRQQHPDREIVVVTETCFMGANPMILGAPLPKGFTIRPKVVNLHAVPYVATSIDTGPMGTGLPPDATESGRARNALLNQMMAQGPFAGPIAQQDAILKELGATEVLEHELPFHHWMLIPDITLQMCPQSLEYPRSDMPSHVKFAGCLPPQGVSPDFVYPEWWEETTRGDKKLVTVTQGTVANDYADLLIPAIQALGDRPDIFVVAILGHRNISLPADVPIPANTRVIDYLPYDAILPHTDVFVMNAGYGGFLHGVTNGVPMVLAGETEDKKDVAMRGEWSGVAVNLRTGRPTSRQVSEGVDRVLADESYRERVREVRAENEAMDTMDMVEREIMAILE